MQHSEPWIPLCVTQCSSMAMTRYFFSTSCLKPQSYVPFQTSFGRLLSPEKFLLVPPCVPAEHPFVRAGRGCGGVLKGLEVFGPDILFVVGVDWIVPPFHNNPATSWSTQPWPSPFTLHPPPRLSPFTYVKSSCSSLHPPPQPTGVVRMRVNGETRRESINRKVGRGKKTNQKEEETQDEKMFNFHLVFQILREDTRIPSLL